MTPDERAEWLGIRVRSVRKHMPAVFAAATLDDDQVEAWCADLVAGRRSPLILNGNIGAGKTHTAWACWPHLIGLGWIGSFHGLSEQDLLDSYLPGGDRARGDKASIVDLLLLDDLGSAALSDWSRARLTALIDQRWQHQRATIITTNMPSADMASHLGDRATSRIAQGATTVRVVGADRRTTA